MFTYPQGTKTGQKYVR